MRKSITLFDDQYAFYKELKSEKLLVAFVEFMFEDIEPQWLNTLEQTIRNSLLERMDNWKWKSDAWSKWWSNSKGGWRPKKSKTDKQAKNKQKTSKITNRKQAKNNQVEVEDKEEVEDKDKVKEEVDKKNKYKDFVYLSESEHQKLVTQLWQKLTDELIDKLNNYIWSTWKTYKSHYFTILNRSKNETTTTHSQAELMKERDRQRRLEEAQAILTPKQNNNGHSIQTEWTNRRTIIGGG